MIMEQLRHISETRQVSIILASHDPMVLDYCAREIRMQDGRLVHDRRIDSHAR
jgi:ABC-type lipoprotein export system ATPase subunit